MPTTLGDSIRLMRRSLLSAIGTVKAIRKVGCETHQRVGDDRTAMPRGSMFGSERWATTMERCKYCGGRLDRPGLFGCRRKPHPKPDTAQKIVAAIESDLRDRRGLRQEFEAIDDDIQDEIRDTWAAIVRKVIR